MRKRIWLLVLAGMASCVCNAGAESTKVTAVLSRALAPYQEVIKGYGQDGTWDLVQVNLEGDVSQGRKIEQSISENKSQVVLALGTEALTALKNNWPTVPVVYSMVLEPYSSSDRRVAGVAIQIPQSEQMARLIKILPGVKKVGVIYNAAYSMKVIAQARDTAAVYDLNLIAIAVEKAEEVPAALASLSGAGVGVLWSVIDPTLMQPGVVTQIIHYALDHKLPFIGLTPFHVKAGALATFSIDYADIGAQAAELARKLLANQPAPNEMPRKIVIYVNPQTQKALGLDILSKLPEARPME
jgi:putative tryptophan/tyrosine transport system substrate-binding protein